MGSLYEHEVSVEQEIANTSAGRPHVLLLGAGASKAALPNGDKNGKQVPLLRDVAGDLELATLFPQDLKRMATDNFESAYSKLYDRGDQEALSQINGLVHRYFSDLELPDEPIVEGESLTSHRANILEYVAQKTRESDRKGTEARSYFRAVFSRVAIANQVDPQ